MVQVRNQTVYLIRHAEAAHNIKEREAVERVKAAKGSKEEQERARKAVIDDEALRDAPLSSDGRSQVQHQSTNLTVMHRVCSCNSMDSMSARGDDDSATSSAPRFEPPQIVLVSPLRRALMTATDLFLHTNAKFIALEALREKRTGFAADERSSLEVLEKEFPHVDFSDLKTSVIPPTGEDNAGVRERGRVFLEGVFAHEYATYPSIALVTHKGWLREHRKTLKGMVDENRLQADFDIDQWDQTLYKNAEIRVAQFGWNEETHQLVSVVSRSVENVIGSVVEGAIKHLIDTAVTLHTKIMSSQSLQRLAPRKEYDDFPLDDDIDDEDSEEDDSDSDEEEEDEEDDFLFYDDEEEEQVQTTTPPLSPANLATKIAGMEIIEQASPTTVTKHIALP